MTRFAARLRSAYAAALLAVALLAFAGVKSTVMQAAELSPAAATPMCGMAMGTASDDAVAGKPGKAGKAHAACDFCAAAAHAPLTCAAVATPAPGAVAYAPARAPGALGPRGPPAVQPRARGPPLPLLA